MWNIFEQPWTLLIIAIVVLIITRIMSSFLLERYQRWWSIPGIAMALMAFGFDVFVETDREQIHHLIKAVVKAVENEDCQELSQTISEHYSDPYHHNKRELMRNAQLVLRPPLIDNIYESITHLQIAGQAAEVTLLNRILFDRQSSVANYTNVMLAEVKLYLHKQSDGRWLIEKTELLTINNRPAKWGDINYQQW